MSSKIFKSVFFTSILVLTVSLALVFSVLSGYFETQIFSELESEASYIAYAINDDPQAFLNSFESDTKRITIITPDGSVLSDTAVDADNLENHSTRQEIKDALSVGNGKSALLRHAHRKNPLLCHNA